MRCVCAFAFLAAALTVAGCGSNGPKLVPVRGKITIEGVNPAGNGITFILVGSEPQVRASAPLKSDGSFELKSYPRGDGAQPGRYKVLLELEPQVKKYERYSYVQGTPIEIEVPPDGVTDLDIKVPWPKK